MSSTGSGVKRKRADAAVKLVPQSAAESNDEGEEDVPVAAPGLFARAFEAVMKRDIAPEKGTAVLAKRKTAVAKQVDRERLEAKAAAELRKERKAARVAQLVVPTLDTLGYERQLKKVATKGGAIAHSLLALLCPCPYERSDLHSGCSLQRHQQASEDGRGSYIKRSGGAKATQAGGSEAGPASTR